MNTRDDVTTGLDPAVYEPHLLPEPVQGTTLIANLVPAAVATSERCDDSEADLEILSPEELSVVARAVPKRQREFTTVRLCARRALGALGLPPVALVPNKRGAPQWPDGVVGSMTHCAGYRAAAVARSTDFASIGIDAEPNEPLPKGVLDVVSLPEERAWLREHHAAAPRVCWDRLLFSAKESVFKVWYPLTRRELDFSEAVLTVTDPDTGTFDVRLLVSGPEVRGRRLNGFSGRWLCRDGLVVTAIAL